MGPAHRNMRRSANTLPSDVQSGSGKGKGKGTMDSSSFNSPSNSASSGIQSGGVDGCSPKAPMGGQGGFPGTPFFAGTKGVNDNNPELLYTGVWTLTSEDPTGQSLTTHSTHHPGSRVSFNFTGSEIKVFGIVPPSNTSHPAPTAAYTIDDLPAVTSAIPQATQCIENYVFFDSSTLHLNSSNLNHTLTVDVLNASAPYILDYLVFTDFSEKQDNAHPFGGKQTGNSSSSSNKNGSSNDNGGSSKYGGNSNSSSNPFHDHGYPQKTPSNSAPSMSPTAIVAIVVGVLALLIAILCLILLHRRRWRRLHAQQSQLQQEQGEFDKNSDIMKWTSIDSILGGIRSTMYAPSSYGSSDDKVRVSAVYQPYASPVRVNSPNFATNPSLSPRSEVSSVPQLRSVGGRPMSAPPQIRIEEV